MVYELNKIWVKIKRARGVEIPKGKKSNKK
jgi:hypothetical protein